MVFTFFRVKQEHAHKKQEVRTTGDDALPLASPEKTENEGHPHVTPFLLLKLHQFPSLNPPLCHAEALFWLTFLHHSHLQ